MMECLIIGINYIFPVKLLKLSLNGKSGRKTAQFFQKENAIPKEPKSVRKKRGFVKKPDLNQSGLTES
jgi:hypothetical protein